MVELLNQTLESLGGIGTGGCTCIGQHRLGEESERLAISPAADGVQSVDTLVELSFVEEHYCYVAYGTHRYIHIGGVAD